MSSDKDAGAYSLQTFTQVFFNDFCEVFQSSFFAEQLQANAPAQLTFTCSKSTIETLEKVVKYV